MYKRVKGFLVNMEGSATTTISSGAVEFLKDTILPVGTDVLKWATTTDGIKEFFYMVLIGAMIGLFNRIRLSFR